MQEVELKVDQAAGWRPLWEQGEGRDRPQQGSAVGGPVQSLADPRCVGGMRGIVLAAATSSSQ